MATDGERHDEPFLYEFAADVEAVREALADMDAGERGIPLDEFDREFRRRHGLP